MTQRIYTSINLEISLQETASEGSQEYGIFTGYANKFGIVDEDNDVVDTNSFPDGIEIEYPLLWNHDSSEVIGLVRVELRDEGIFVTEGQITLATQRGREVYQLVKQKLIKSMSIGYTGGTYERIQDQWFLRNLKLAEISLTSIPANNESDVIFIKSLKDQAKTPKSPTSRQDSVEQSYSMKTNCYNPEPMNKQDPNLETEKVEAQVQPPETPPVEQGAAEAANQPAETVKTESQESGSSEIETLKAENAALKNQLNEVKESIVTLAKESTDDEAVKSMIETADIRSVTKFIKSSFVSSSQPSASKRTIIKGISEVMTKEDKPQESAYLAEQKARGGIN